MARATRRYKAQDPTKIWFSIAGPGMFLLVYSWSGSLPLGIFAAIISLSLGIALLRLVEYREASRLRQSGIAEVDQMKADEFYRYLAALLDPHYDQVSILKEGLGADLLLVRKGHRIVVQAKLYKRRVGARAIQEVVSAVAYYKADEAWVVTNRDYTDDAVTLAHANKVRLLNREDLIALAQR